MDCSLTEACQLQDPSAAQADRHLLPINSYIQIVDVILHGHGEGDPVNPDERAEDRLSYWATMKGHANTDPAASSDELPVVIVAVQVNAEISALNCNADELCNPVDDQSDGDQDDASPGQVMTLADYDEAAVDGALHPQTAPPPIAVPMTLTSRRS